MLERESLWYRYKTQVWREDTDQAAAIHNAMRVLRSVHNNGSALAYVSVPITSGKHFYDTRLAAPDASLSAIMHDNYLTGYAFTRAVEARRSCAVLYPADLVPARQKWTQAHFQALWLSIIAEKCTEVHMSEDWEYSSGCAEEFTHTLQLRLGLPSDSDLAFYNTKGSESAERMRMRNIAVFDHRGGALTLDEGVERIRNASAWLQRKGFGVDRLDECLGLLASTKQRLDAGFYQ